MGRRTRLVAATGIAALLGVVGLWRCTAVDHSSGDAEVMATGLEVPWGLTFMPGGDALVGERTTGDIYAIPTDGGERRRVGTVPDVEPDGEGGLLGIAVSPTFARDSLVYAYLTTDSDNRIVRFRLDPGQAAFDGLQVLVDDIDQASIHNGGALAWGPDGMLYAGVGDAGDPDNAQDPDILNGKILRMDPLGEPPADNPDPTSLVWSMGHRNVQGLAWDDQERMWATEFGQNSFDEVNLIEPGSNYGWPEVEGRVEGESAGNDEKFIEPEVTWSTDEASPSGLAFADGRLFAGALRGERLWTMPVDGEELGDPESRLEDQYGRLRSVARAPDDTLWVTTSNRDGRGNSDDDDDRVLRLDP